MIERGEQPVAAACDGVCDVVAGRAVHGVPRCRQRPVCPRDVD